ncbi:MAG: peptide chain release factor N(5)-glutamine methyltransferase, partial [Rhodocyclaceae bacterium]|nr:peptide chain release factor N(5)-glutamine methyltransferase [Rhodocyclaceae bacterium]
MTTLARLLDRARAAIPAAEARLLLGHLLGRPAAWLAAHDDESVPPQVAAQLMTLVARRAAGEPIAYLVGEREFYGRRFGVTPAVLIPRPETELLVELGIAKVGAGRTADVLDLGTGSGCIALTLALELPQAHVTAADASPAALAIARENAQRLGASVNFLLSDWFAQLPAQRFDLIVANPPYVAANDPHLTIGDLRFEPLMALTDHGDGLGAIRTLVAAAPGWLKP